MGDGNGNGSGPWTHTFGDEPPPPRTARGSMVTLADGHQWRVPPLNFYERQTHAAVLERAVGDVNWMHTEAQDALVALLVVSLQRNYPGIPAEELTKLLDIEAAAECFKVVWAQEGMKLRDMLSHLGLAPPPSPSPNPPTGAASTDG